jgi:ribosomal protein L29
MVGLGIFFRGASVIKVYCEPYLLYNLFEFKAVAEEELHATKKQLFELRLKKATRQSFKPHLFKHNKRRIAQLLTLESEKQQQIK